MARSRRTRFAASFVAVVAAGCSHEGTGGTGPGTGSAVGSGSGSAPGSASGSATPTDRWYVNQNSDGTCSAMPHVDCPPPSVATCNPPPPIRLACPAGVTAAAGVQVLSFDGGKTCVVDVAGRPATACPSYDAPPPPPDAGVAFQPRRWDISAGDGKECYAELLTFSCPPGATCNPPAPSKVTCPPYNAGNHVDEIAPGKCQMLLVLGGGHCPPKMHCNPPPPREVDVPCP